MAEADAILGRNIANPTRLDVSALTGDSSSIGDAQIPLGTPESTLDVDPVSFAASTRQPDAASQDIDLAQRRVTDKPVEGPDAANERAAAIGGVAGTAVKAGVSIWANMESLKAQDKIFQERIQRGFETLEFNQRMIRNSRNMSALNNSLNAIDSLNKQGGNVVAGGQEQLFLRSPNTGRLV